MTATTDNVTPGRGAALERLLCERIVILDGAMGTTIRSYGMTEADMRGERFKGSKKDLLNKKGSVKNGS